jgi:tetratricopeptide (TPR) repeat protein
MRTVFRFVFVSLLLPVFLSGCTPPEPAYINQGTTALNANQPQEAISSAQAYLQIHPTGPDAAEAWYIIGRSDEMLPAQQDQARQAYQQALALHPTPAQQADIRAGLANVAFFQGDYATALQEWSTAYDGLTDHATRAWTLYRMGLCQQRLGQFAQADTTFHIVQHDYNDTPAAERAAQKTGYREFYVQVGVYENPKYAWANLNTLRQLGIGARIFRNVQGRHVLCAGPVSTYVQASSLRLRVAGKYSGAVIVP